VGVARPCARWVWIVTPPVLFAASVFALGSLPESAELMTMLAVVAVPVLATLAATRLAWGSRPAWAVAIPVLLVASMSADKLAGQVGTTLLCALSAVALGAGLVRLGGARWVMIGLSALAAADIVLVADGRVQAAARALSESHVGRLPELSHVALGTFTLGYGDLVVAGIVGAIASRRPGGQLRVAGLTALLMLLEGGLMAGSGPYPATVPVVGALLLDESVWALRSWRRAASTQRCIAA
jgi:hypothetical protein